MSAYPSPAPDAPRSSRSVFGIGCSPAAWIASIAAALLLSCSGSVVREAERDAGAPTPDAESDAGTPPSDASSPEAAYDAPTDQGAETSPPPDADGPIDIGDALASIPGMSITYDAWSAPYRVFHLELEQPVDHDDPSGPTFRQHLTLLHRSETAPTVLYSTGYFLYFDTEPAEITYMAGANQIAVEHRYFGSSSSDLLPWKFLTIQQAAADHHRVVQALRPLYPQRWLSTGHSKGGMTSVYHRRFFPDDVDATVAYVAPLSLAAGDDRYVAFLEQVGDADCRDRLTAAQRRLLERKATLLPEMAAFGSFDILGVEKAFEHSVVEAPFTFWQYYGSSFCNDVPGPTAPDTELWGFLNTYTGVGFTTDEGVLSFRPYFYQAATQLGYPAYDESAYADLEAFPGSDVPASYTEPGVPIEFDPGAMADVDAWVTTQGRELMFLYGEEDPWTAGAFHLGQASDSYWYEVPLGTHASLLNDLPDAQRAEAMDTLARWLDTPLSSAPLQQVKAIRQRVMRAPM